MSSVPGQTEGGVIGSICRSLTEATTVISRGIFARVSGVLTLRVTL